MSLSHLSHADVEQRTLCIERLARVRRSASRKVRKTASLREVATTIADDGLSRIAASRWRRGKTFKPAKGVLKKRCRERSARPASTCRTTIRYAHRSHRGLRAPESANGILNTRAPQTEAAQTLMLARAPGSSGAAHGTRNSGTGARTTVTHRGSTFNQPGRYAIAPPPSTSTVEPVAYGVDAR